MKLLITTCCLFCIIFIKCGTTPAEKKITDKVNTSAAVADSNKAQAIEDTEKSVLASIRDTIHKIASTKELLVKSKWQYVPMPSCISYYKFFKDGSGIEYDCEVEEKYDIKYSIVKDTVLIEQYDTPKEDNPNKKRIKSRDDKFFYTGDALVMIDSKIYSVDERSSDPGILDVIRYERR